MANDKANGLVSRLLSSDATFGIVAGLTALAAASHPEDEEDDDEGAYARGGVDGNGRRLGVAVALPGVGEDRRTGRKKTKPAGSPSTADASPSSSVAKKYSVAEQRDAIRKLHERNQRLKQELSIEFRDAKQLLTQEKRERVEYLHKMTTKFTKKVDAAKKAVAKLDEQIAAKEHELETLRQQHIGGSAADSGSSSSMPGQTSTEGPGGGDTSAALARRVRSLENRVELSLVKRNEMDSITKHLRSQIDKVRKDRVIFDGIYKKLERELSEFQTRHDACVNELRRATLAKEAVANEIQQIQADADREQRHYEWQFKELRAAIEVAMREVQQSRGSSSLCSLPAEAADDGTKSTLWPRGATVASPVANESPVSPAVASVSPLKRLTALSTWKIGFDKALTTTNDHLVATYDQVFDGIKKMTGLPDVQRIAEAITRKDEENFKRFKHVEELHREEAALKAHVEQLTQSIEEFKANEGIAAGTTQKQQYRVLEAKYKRVLETNKAYDVEFEETNNKLARVKSSIHSIHSMLVHANCAKNADQFSLHGNANLALGAHSARDITDTNVVDYLQAIEIFTSSLMKEHHEASASSMANASRDHGRRQGVGGVHTAASSPIARGPPTLSSDPAQKLRIQVPSFGGVNGMIILPAATSPDPMAEVRSRHSSMVNAQQPHSMQRKKTARFELSSRKSLSMQQFAAALAAASNPSSPAATPSSAASNSSSLGRVEDARVASPYSSSLGTPSTATGGSLNSHASTIEDDEEERAYTYEELREFAAKRIVKKRDDRGSSPTRPTLRSRPSSPSKL